MKTTQFFSPEYLNLSKKISSEEVVQFLETFRDLQQTRSSKSILISLKVDEELLKAFRKKCEFLGLRYQSTIKDLMKNFLSSDI